MTLPNTLTVSRIILTLIFVLFILQKGLAPKIIASVVFLIASFTDYYDGYYAKKYHLISNFGKFMDPVADKILMLTAFFIFTKMHIVALWMFVIIFVREVVITALRLLAMTQGKVLAAEKAGKYKTVSQIVAVCFILIYIILSESGLSQNWSTTMMYGWHYGIYFLMLIAIALTLVSGILYLWHNRCFV